MKKIITFIIIYICLFTVGVNCLEEKDVIYNKNMKRDLLCIMVAYGDYINDIEKSASGNVYIIMKSGKKFLYDDKINKSIEDKLQNPDIQDMMEQIYTLESINAVMNRDYDPGRIRHYGILNDVYGKTQKEIENNIKNFGGYGFNKNNKCGESLKVAMNRVVSETKENKSIGAYVFPISGTYNYRLISGTGRLSPHAYGIAIDLKSHPWDYWKWASNEQGSKRIQNYSKELVKIFEDNNFVWGGKWNHFDILHFEYRPEIIIKAKYFGQNNGSSNWYDGNYNKNEVIDKYIKLIEEKIN